MNIVDFGLTIADAIYIEVQSVDQVDSERYITLMY